MGAFEDREWGFNFVAPPSVQSTGTLKIDDILTELADLKNCKGIDDVRRKLYPPTLFEGFRNPDEAYKTVRMWLEEIEADTRNHLQLGSDMNWDIRLTESALYANCSLCLSKKNGWNAESLQLLLDANLAFLENSGTKLKLRKEEGRRLKW